MAPCCAAYQIMLYVYRFLNQHALAEHTHVNANNSTHSRVGHAATSQHCPLRLLRGQASGTAAGCACGRQLWALLLVSSLLPVLRLAGLAALHASEVKQTWNGCEAAVFSHLYVMLHRHNACCAKLQTSISSLTHARLPALEPLHLPNSAQSPQHSHIGEPCSGRST